MCLLHVGAALLISLGLHAGYRQLVGSLTGRPAAYLHWDGLFLISAWAPLLQSEDATDHSHAQCHCASNGRS